jgi:ligand-binding sensor domain-containing protein
MKNLIIILTILFASVTTTNAQWQQTTAPVGNSINCLSVFNTNIFAGTAGGGIIMSSDSGTNWVAKNTGISNLNIKAMGSDTSGNLYAGSNSLILYTSSDSGNNWISHSAGGTGTSISSIAAYGTNVLLGEAGDGVFKSVNHGVSWSEVGLCCASVLSLCSEQNGYVFAGTNTTVYRSSGTFTNWTQVNSGLSSIPVRVLVTSGNTIFAGTYGNGIYISANNGASWTQANNGLTDLHVISMAATDSKILAGTDAGGVFYSIDNGLNWIQVNENLSFLNIPSLVICGTYVYAGTTNGGIWKRPLSEFTMIKEINNNPEIVVSPNPASNIITVYFDSNMEPDATLKIYDILGSLMMLEPLRQERNEIDVSSFIKGIYLIEVTTKNHTEKQKIIIQK